MKQDRASIEARLAPLAPGELRVVSRAAAGQPPVPLAGSFSASTDGKGQCEVYPVGPGVAAAFHTFLAAEAAFHHAASDSVLELFHCRSGRVGWNLRGGTAIYLGAGDLTAHSAACCADSAMLFPVGYAEGLSIRVDLPVFAAHCPAVLREAGVDFQKIQAAFCREKPAAISACPQLEHIFAPLYAAAEARRGPYLRLKVQELFLLLQELGPQQRELPQYYARQTEQIRQIHRQLTEHLDQRFTIEALAKQYLLNTSTLKAVFKAVYGLPIATYMKEYRVRRAMQLLRETDAPISEIARQVGYETQGKFSQAFRDVAKLLPTQYRKTYDPQPPAR